MDPKVCGKLLTTHAEGDDDDEELRDGSPSGGAPKQAPRWDLKGTEGYGGRIRVFSLLLMVSGYVDLYRRKEDIGGGGCSRGPRGRGGVPPPSWTPRGSPDVVLKSPVRDFLQKYLSQRFHSVWTPFDILFLQNPETGKKQQSGLGLWVSRLVPKCQDPDPKSHRSSCNTSYHFAASRTVTPRVPPYLARDRLRILAHVYDSVASIHMTENPGRHG